MSISPVPSWSMQGVVTEKRELVAEKSGKAWLYSIKLMAMGGTYALTTKDEKLFNSVADGEVINASGTFEPDRSSFRFAVTQMESLSSSAPKISKAS